MASAGGMCAGIIGQRRAREELHRYREVRVRLLLLGAGGQVGRAVVKAAPAAHEVIAKGRSELDIAGPGAAAGRPPAGRRRILSTDSLFDGTSGRPYCPSDGPNPLRVSGVSKLG